MRILLCSHSFSPEIGGIETVSLLIARAWQEMGEDVRVVTRAAGTLEDDFDLHVVRQPDKHEFARQVGWADVILQNNISLPWVVPILRSRKPWVCANHTWPRNEQDKIDLRGWMKLWAARLAKDQLGVSQVQAKQFLGHPIVVGNPYDDAFFKPAPGVDREMDLLFLGRLTRSKGIDLAIEAMPLILAERPQTHLSIVGRGEERELLQAQVEQLGISESVTFLGALFGEEVLTQMSRHKVVLVPSRSAESFGIVVIEALACGCVVIGSDCGGVPEAVGPAGLVVPKNDVSALAYAALRLLETPELLESLRAAGPAHIAQFAAHAVAKRYLEVLRKAAGSTSQ